MLSTAQAEACRVAGLEPDPVQGAILLSVASGKDETVILPKSEWADTLNLLHWRFAGEGRLWLTYSVECRWIPSYLRDDLNWEQLFAISAGARVEFTGSADGIEPAFCIILRAE